MLEGLINIWTVGSAAVILVSLWHVRMSQASLAAIVFKVKEADRTDGEHLPSIISCTICRVDGAILTLAVGILAGASWSDHSGSAQSPPKARAGQLVRIGPKECSFYSLEIYKVVYAAGSPWAKDPRVYSHFVQDGHPALFSITDPKEHAQRRRLMGQIFNRSKMPMLESMMHEQTSRFIEAIRNYDTIVDLTSACRALESDIVSSFGFGSAIGGIDSWVRHQDLDMVAENDKLSQWIALHSNLPGLISFYRKIESMVYNITGWRSKAAKTMEKFDQWSRMQLEDIMYHKRGPSLSPNYIEVMIRSGLPAESALSEAKEMLGPGTETTSASLAHVLWGLAHDQQYQSELVADLAAAGWPKDMTSLESIHRLRAAVKEGIRWTGAAAAMLPRVSPAGGATLDGKFIPEGTVLSSSPIWYLHDELAFPSPYTYHPQRWLEDATVNPLRDEYYIPFSKGSNTCVGSHFAYLEIYIALSQILRHFHIRHLRPGWTDTAAVLPPRKEWVSAVPLVKLEVQFSLRNER